MVPAPIDAARRSLEALSSEGRRLLEAACILGEPADGDLLAEIAGLEPSRAQSALGTTYGAGLLARTPDGRLAIPHDLIAEAVERRLMPARRRALHAAAGAALERRGVRAGDPRLARHLICGCDLAALRRGITHAASAARSARRALAFEDAAELYALALHALDLGAENVEALRATVAAELAEALDALGATGPPGAAPRRDPAA